MDGLPKEQRLFNTNQPTWRLQVMDLSEWNRGCMGIDCTAPAIHEKFLLDEFPVDHSSSTVDFQDIDPGSQVFNRQSLVKFLL